MIDYGIYYRRVISTGRIADELPMFDVFVSAYNSSDRVRRVFDEVRARRKLWLIHPEYCYTQIEEPTGAEVIRCSGTDEVNQVNDVIGAIGGLHGKSICIDITGVMRHVLVFLVTKLKHSGVNGFDVLYSEPISYIDQEHTTFSTTTSGAVRPVRGMSGSNSGNARDYLIISVGYDHKLISEVAGHKDNATVYPVFAFPSLSPDMYQQSALRASDSGEIALQGEWFTNRRFAPGNDPFATAAVVRDIVAEIDRREQVANIYLSPLATKAHALGFALYWVLEGQKRGSVSLLLPECVTYSRETSVGLRRLWSFSIELGV